ARGCPQRSSQGDDEERSGAAAAALEVLKGAGDDLVGGAGCDRGEVVDQRLGGRLADQPEKRDQRKQGGKDREYAVIGQRGRPDGEVVLTELRHGALEHSAPRFAL